MTSTQAVTVLKWFLIVFGAMAVAAVVPMVMPTDWMETINDALGLGPFQRSPLMEYLTRSLSALYAMVGALVVYLGINAGRYLELIVVVGWLTIALGIALTVLDFAIGMPATWTWGEGPPTVVVGAFIIWLAKKGGAS